MRWLKKLLQETTNAFQTPTAKQKEAYGRFAHTLSAANCVGAVSVMFTESHVTLYAVARVGALAIWGVLLFWIGAILSRGE